MGLTQFTIDTMTPFLRQNAARSIIELGAQNLYGEYKYGAYASEFYKDVYNMEYKCIDLNGENDALKIDLSQQYKPEQQFDIVTDFGTSEHVGVNNSFDWKAIYNCWKIKHDLCKEDGLIISENPKTGNWPGHGYNYYTQDFYRELALVNGYLIHEIGEHPAMGNDMDGWNVYCILRKTASNEFMKLTDFKKLPLQKK